MQCDKYASTGAIMGGVAVSSITGLNCRPRGATGKDEVREKARGPLGQRPITHISLSQITEGNRQRMAAIKHTHTEKTASQHTASTFGLTYSPKDV